MLSVGPARTAIDGSSHSARTELPGHVYKLYSLPRIHAFCMPRVQARSCVDFLSVTPNDLLFVPYRDKDAERRRSY